MKGKVIVLGCGASTGVPVIGCHCAVCKSESPFNKRLRPSIVIEMGGKTCLVDCGPDFRLQAISHGIDHLDALILTHTHFDHIAGIDDLRIFCRRQKKALPCFLSKTSFEDIQKRYYYLFAKDDESTVRFSFQLLDAERGVVDIFGSQVRYFTYQQNEMEVTGYRFGDFAYVTDIKQYPESLFEDLKGVKTLILSGLRRGHSAAHLTVEQAVSFIQRVSPERCFINHMGHELDFEELKMSLPTGIEPAFDGLHFTFEYPHD